MNDQTLLDYVIIVLGFASFAMVSILVRIALGDHPPESYPAIAGIIGVAWGLCLATVIIKRRRRRVK